MPTYYARKSGNVNATDVWATTPTGTAAAVTFAAGDVLVANSFTITLNVDTNLGSTGEVRNDTTGGATAGGSFTLNSGVTLTANVFAGTAGNVSTQSAAGNTAIVGSITGGSGNSVNAVSHNGTGTLTITGSVTGGSGGAVGVRNNSTGPVVITGNVSGGQNGIGLSNSGAANISITGNVTAGGGASFSEGLYNNSTGQVTVVGNVNGGPSTSSGINNVSTGSVIVTGTVTGSVSAGIINGANGTVTVTGRAKGGPLASSAVGVVGSATGITSVDEIEYGDLGASPVSGPIRLSDKSSNVAVMYRFGTTKKTLTDPNATGLMPSAANVRFGTVYNGGNSTGTMRVPAAGSVALGVPVDNTTGTAALTPAAVWNHLTSAATTSGSMGERLKDAATVASTGQQLANALTP